MNEPNYKILGVVLAEEKRFELDKEYLEKMRTSYNDLIYERIYGSVCGALKLCKRIKEEIYGPDEKSSTIS